MWTPRLIKSGIAFSAQRMVRHEGGSVGLIFALALVPVVLTVGAVVDYSMASNARTRLNAAADSAALAAVGRMAIATSDAAAQTTAQNMFAAGSAGMNDVNITNVSVNVATAGLVRTAVVTYTATRQANFGAIFGITSIPLSGQATAKSDGAGHVDFYLLLDNTPSMGVGATTADVNTMVDNTPDQCAFACHDLSNPNNYYNLAKKLGVTMRIDVVRQATQQLMDTAVSTAIFPDQFRAAVYTFGPSADAAKLTTIAPLTTDLASVKAATAGVDLMTVNGQNQFSDQDTNFEAIFPAIDAVIPAMGPGTQASPQKVLFFVSDGVADEQNSATCTLKLSGQRCQEPINVALCKKLKDRGLLIAVLYTTYLPLPSNSWYNTWIKPFAYNIGPSMQACASPGLYFEVSMTDGIPQAMSALFQKAVAFARLAK